MLFRSQYQVLQEFIDETKFKVISNVERQNYKDQVQAFINDLAENNDSNQYDVYVKAIEHIKSTMEFRCKDDIDLYSSFLAIDACYNGFATNEFYENVEDQYDEENKLYSYDHTKKIDRIHIEEE